MSSLRRLPIYLSGGECGRTRVVRATSRKGPDAAHNGRQSDTTSAFQPLIASVSDANRSFLLEQASCFSIRPKENFEAARDILCEVLKYAQIIDAAVYSNSVNCKLIGFD